jgi:hypothetical protein
MATTMTPAQVLRDRADQIEYDAEMCALCGMKRSEHRDSSVGLACRRSQLSVFQRVTLVPGERRLASFDVPITERIVVPATPAVLTAAEIVRAAFAAALDGETIDPRFLILHTAASVIEAQVMLTYQRPLTPRDQINLGIEAALENNRRHPERRAEFQATFDAYEAQRVMATYEDADDNGDNVAVGEA